MLRKKSKAVPEGNGPVPQEEELESGQLTMGDVYRLLVKRFYRQLEIMDNRFDRQLIRMDSYFDRLDDEMRKMDQHLTRLEHGARQPRLAMEADG